MSAFTMRQGVDAYVEQLKAEGKSANTIGVYERSLALAIAHFGEDRDLKKLMPAHVAGYLRSDPVNKKPSGEPRAPVSVEQVRRVFRQMLVFCKEQGTIDGVPLPKDELAKVKVAGADAG